MSKHLLVIDGLNVVRRIYEANLAPDSPAKAQGAVKSSVQSLRRALTEHAPTHAVAFFDHGGTTWRHDMYAPYRQSRKPMPQVLRDVLPELYTQVEATLQVACRTYPGIEADDAIGQTSLAWRKAFPEDSVTALSTDKDIAQLIADGVRVWDHFKNECRDTAWVVAKFGVEPALLGDLLALMGDASDDIPGIPKVGVKTAAKLLNEYGSLQAVLAAGPTIPGALGLKLQTNADDARLSRQLVSFKLDSTLGLSWKDLRVSATPG
jgi:5'-3' exonuclease